MPRTLCCLLLCTVLVGCDNSNKKADALVAELNAQTAALKAATDAKLKAEGCSIEDNSSGWTIKTCISKMDKTKSVTVSKSDVIVRCNQHKTEAYIHVGTQVEGEYGTDLRTVRVKVDGGSPSTQHWSEATSGDALFSPTPRQFAEQLAKSKTLYFEYTPFRESKRVLEKDISRLSEVLPNVSDACNWKADDIREKSEAATRKRLQDAVDAENARHCAVMKEKCASEKKSGEEVGSYCVAYNVQCGQ
ncbi:MAG TPA: hypothetical protein VKW78_06120 [Terriglobales bacterium]|nr:hypothetical protein [Terriglobales bacterium]